MKLTALTIAVVGAVALGGPAIANASTLTADSSRCTTAKSETAKAKTSYADALDAAVVRAQALGFTAEAIATAKATLVDGKITATEQAKLLALYAGRDADAQVNVETDLPLIKAVLDSRLSWNAAVAAQNVECASSGDLITPSKAPATGGGPA